MVKRYDCTHGNARYCYGCYTMEEAELGDWVKHDDHAALAARLAECEAKLHEIGDYAHEHSAGPTVPDHLWTVREMAYGALGATDSADAAPVEWRHGEGQFSHIAYCTKCHYSRSWINQHGHGKDCPHYTAETVDGVKS